MQMDIQGAVAAMTAGFERLGLPKPIGIVVDADTFTRLLRDGARYLGTSYRFSEWIEIDGVRITPAPMK